MTGSLSHGGAEGFESLAQYHPPAVGTVAGLISRKRGFNSRTVDNATRGELVAHGRLISDRREVRFLGRAPPPRVVPESAVAPIASVGSEVRLNSRRMQSRFCVECRQKRRITAFQPLERNGRSYRKHVCRRCVRRRPGRRAAVNAAVRRRRRQNVAAAIREDSRRYDKRRGLHHDLSAEWIRDAISNGCAYCGENSIRMTLDRKDNDIGHVSTNVVPACLRCNYTRRDMPYAAWLLLVPAMRRARELGLFADWTGAVAPRSKETRAERSW